MTIVSIQGHRLERLLIKPAARAWMEEHVTRERSSTGDLGRNARDVVVDAFEFG